MSTMECATSNEATPASPACDTDTDAERVEVDVIEGSKENIQPTRRGHNPHALLRSLHPSPAPSSPSPSLSTQRAGLESAILSYTGADPLLPYLHYIQWTLSSYPSLSQPSHLLPLLEKTTRTFLPHPLYLNDPRYIRVWLLYAERCPHPGDVYQFLHSRGLGSQVALRFVEWSAWHERVGRMREAEDALQLGIDCRAQPHNTLRLAMKGLHARNARRLQQQLAQQMADRLDPLSDVALSAMNDHPTRRVLSSLTPTSTPSPSPSAPTSSPQSHRSAITLPSSSLPIAIYTDASTPSPPLPTGAWRHLPSRGVVDKENAVGVSTWRVGLGKGKGVGVGGVGDRGVGGERRREGGVREGGVEVWMDEECERREREEEAARVRGEASVLREEEERRRKAEGMRRRMDAAAAAKAPHSRLSLDPLRNMQRAQQPHTATTAAPTGSSAAAAPLPPQSAVSAAVPANRPLSRPLTVATSGLVVSLRAGGRSGAAAGSAAPSATSGRGPAGGRPPPPVAATVRKAGASQQAEGGIFDDFAHS